MSCEQSLVELDQTTGSIANARKVCSPQINPTMIMMFDKNVLFTISDLFCNNDQPGTADTVKIVFDSKRRKREVEGNFLENGMVVEGILKRHWGRQESVQVTVSVNGIQLASTLTVSFFHFSEMNNQPEVLGMNRNDAYQYEIEVPKSLGVPIVGSAFELVFSLQDGKFAIICCFSSQHVGYFNRKTMNVSCLRLPTKPVLKKSAIIDDYQGFRSLRICADLQIFFLQGYAKIVALNLEDPYISARSLQIFLRFLQEYVFLQLLRNKYTAFLDFFNYFIEYFR